MPGRPPPSAYLILLGAQVAIGAAAIFARLALTGAGPIAVSALRLTIASVPLLIFSYLRGRKLAIPRKHEVMFGICGLALAAHFGLWIASLLYTSVAVSTLLVCTVPAWTALFDALVLKRAVSKNFWLALFAAAIGVALIVGSGSGAPPVPGLSTLGNMLAFGGSLAFAGYLIAIRSVSHVYPTIVIVGRTYAWAAAGLIVATIIAGQGPPGNNLSSWGGILAMALISQLLGHTGLNASLRWFVPSIVAFSTLLEPVCAAILAALIFAENLSLVTIAGSIIVLGSLAVILRMQPDDVQEVLARESPEL